jgi:hypothetical protein
MPFLRGHRKRQVVTALVVVACAGLFTLQWHQAPRVETSPAVIRELRSARGELYLGRTFEGLPLRTVDPFLYSDCEPGKKKTAPIPCEWVKVEDGHVTGSDPKQVARARKHLVTVP